MKHFLAVLFFTSALAAQTKSAFDKAAMEAYLRHLFLYLPEIRLDVADPSDSGVPGFKKVKVRASLGAQSEEKEFLVSNDGRKILQAQVYDIAENPFKPELDRISTAGAPALGAPGAPVVIVLFSDFQCGYCKEEAKMLRENLLKEFPTQVRLYYKDFPLTQIHDWAQAAAAAGRCVAEQKPDAFWEFHDWVFENQSALTAAGFSPKLTEWAKSKSLDAARLDACRASKETGEAIARTVAEGRDLGVNSTPTMFVNGRRINFAIKWPNLKQVIEFEIGYQKTAKNAGEHCCTLELPNPLAAPK
jgi:protein-disulfide isomerase